MLLHVVLECSSNLYIVKFRAWFDVWHILFSTAITEKVLRKANEETREAGVWEVQQTIQQRNERKNSLCDEATWSLAPCMIYLSYWQFTCGCTCMYEMQCTLYVQMVVACIWIGLTYLCNIFSGYMCLQCCKIAHSLHFMKMCSNGCDTITCMLQLVVHWVQHMVL